MKLIVGLGNPGDKYAGNRHNIGFMAVDEIARGYSFGPWKKRFQGLTAEGQIGTQKSILLKPMTYMNESGRAAGEAMRFYKLSPADVIVIHDELDLKPGMVRVKTGGGNAGHNGLKSVSAYIGNDYKRVRLGIGHPGDKALVVHYVLQDFAKADREWLEPFLDGVARGMDRLVEGGEAAFLSEAARGRVAEKLNGSSAPAAAKIGKKAPKIEATPKAQRSLEAAVAAAVAASTPGGGAAISAATHGGTASGAVSRVVMLPEPERAPEKPAEPVKAPDAGPAPVAEPAPVQATEKEAAPALAAAVSKTPPAPKKKGGFFSRLFHKRVSGGASQH